MKIISWNVNSIRLRKFLLRRVIDDQKPDIIFLQELKCLTEKFPYEDFGDYVCFINGQKQYNGVAILVRNNLECKDIEIIQLGGRDEARYIGLNISNVYYMCFYVPCGQSSVDAYEYKKNFLSHMTSHIDDKIQQYGKTVVGGDMNVAISDHDVQYPEKYVNSVLCANDLRLLMQNLLDLGLKDVLNTSCGQYTWWDYRTPNQGLRIDYVFSNICGEQILLNKYRHLYILDTKPSDHCPVLFSYQK